MYGDREERRGETKKMEGGDRSLEVVWSGNSRIPTLRREKSKRDVATDTQSQRAGRRRRKEA